MFTQKESHSYGRRHRLYIDAGTTQRGRRNTQRDARRSRTRCNCREAVLRLCLLEEQQRYARAHTHKGRAQTHKHTHTQKKKRERETSSGISIRDFDFSSFGFRFPCLSVCAIAITNANNNLHKNSRDNDNKRRSLSVRFKNRECGTLMKMEAGRMSTAAAERTTKRMSHAHKNIDNSTPAYSRHKHTNMHSPGSSDTDSETVV